MTTLLLAINLLVTPPAVTTEKNVVYDRVGETELRADIYYPSDRQKKTKAVALYHGGAWMGGQRTDMDWMGQRLAEEGFVAVSFQYRLAPKSKYPAMIEDARTAVRWMRENEKKLNIDSRKIGSCGLSAGGHLAMLTAYDNPKANGSYSRHSSQTQAVLNFFGPVDMTRDFPRNLDPMFAMVLGKKREDAGPELIAASPLFAIKGRTAPTFIFHGKADPLVPFIQAERLETRLKETRTTYETAYLDGVGHEIGSGPASRDAVNRGVAFLKKHLGMK